MQISEESREQLKSAIEAGEIQGESGQVDEAYSLMDTYGSYLGFTNEQLDYLYNKAIDTTEATDTRLALVSIYQNKFGKNSPNDSGAVNENENRELYRHIMNTEKYNFNNIKWVNYNHNQEGGVEIPESNLYVNTSLGVKYPNDGSTTADTFFNLTSPYLLTNSIPLGFTIASTFEVGQSNGIPSNDYIFSQIEGSGIEYEGDGNNVGEFAYQIIKYAQSDITVDQYQLSSLTMNTSYKHYTAYKKRDSFTIAVKVGNVSTFLNNSLTSGIIAALNTVGVDSTISLSGTVNTQQISEEEINTRWDENKQETPTREDFVGQSTSVENVYYVSAVEAFDVIKNTQYNYVKYSQEDVNNRTHAISETKQESPYNEIVNSENKIDPNSVLAGCNTLLDVYNKYPNFSVSAGEPIRNSDGTMTVYVTIQGNEYTENNGIQYDVTRTWKDTVTPSNSQTNDLTIDNLYEFNENKENDEEKSTIGKDVLSQSEDVSHYEKLITDKLFNKIDILDSNPKIYSNYLQTGAAQSEYIGLGRNLGSVIITEGYNQVNSYLDEIATDNRLPFIYGSSLGYETGDGAGLANSFGSGFNLLRDYIRAWENQSGPATNADGTKYIIETDGNDHPTVGYGIDIFNGGYAEAFKAAGYSTEIGSEVDVEFVDALEKQEIESCLEYIKNVTNGLDLKEYQLHALTSRAYNCGRTGAVITPRGSKKMTFVESYKAYWNSEVDDLYEQDDANYNAKLFTEYMNVPVTSDGEFNQGLENRRRSEWRLFQTGYYDRIDKWWSSAADMASLSDINLYNSDGSVNVDAINEYQRSIEALFNLPQAPLGGSMYSSVPVTTAMREAVTGEFIGFSHYEGQYPRGQNGLSTFQCTWWANGRASMYLKQYGKKYKQYPTASGNGVQYYSKNVENGWFEYGQTPRPNSIVSFTTSQPEGHVAFVEAVDEVNRVFYISHAGSGKSWYGIKAVSFDYPNIVGFVYLDLEK